MRDIPASVILSWPPPNYEHPETRGDALKVVNAVMISLAAVAVGLRYYARIVVKKAFGWDDAFIGLALFFAASLMAVIFLGNARYGWNVHVWDIPFPSITPALQLVFVSKMMFALAAMFTKLSLLCFYSRLVVNSGMRWFGAVILGCHAFVLMLAIVFIGLTIFDCNPIDEYWTYPPQPSWAAHCISEGLVVVSAGSLNCFADLLVTIVPIPLVLKLNMPLRRRFAVLILFSLGFVITMAGVVRTYYIWEDLLNTYDISWESYPLWIAATIEIDLAVICACLPQIQPLVVIWKVKLRDLKPSRNSSIISGIGAIFEGRNSSSKRKSCSCGDAVESETKESMASAESKIGKGSIGSDAELNIFELAC